MYYSSNIIFNSPNLEYIVRNSYSSISYLSRNFKEAYNFNNYEFNQEPIIFERKYSAQKSKNQSCYRQYEYTQTYFPNHSFAPEIFLNPIRSKTELVEDIEDIKNFVSEIFNLVTKQEFPNDISINILSFEEFKKLHSSIGLWSDGILGFSINGKNKKIFVRENNLDILLLVIGHEIGHVLTKTLSNKHDEEAKAFAFSIEWTKTIKKHNTANLGLNIKATFNLRPAQNGLHDIALSFVHFMLKKGINALELHDNLVKKYTSIFNVFYC